ncbi:peptidase [Pseudarthrobacter sulfonivorans]|uniref:peptidase n=1 Tax=Pseudarthrobacter sulfonivorans TaxID=121292 RepID=UPI002103B9F1|nr:peptidase [Pseudarthrobacter sulfonivorans]
MGSDSGGDGLPRIRRSPSGRTPQWAIDEALGKLQDPDPWRSPPVSQVSARKTIGRKNVSGRKWRRRAATVLGIALVVGLYFTPALFDRYVLPAALPYLPDAKVPPSGFEAASAPLGIPPAASGSTAYILQPSPDPGQRFVAYDPCRPVHYVVRPDNAPPGTERLIEQAVSMVSAASGLQFVYDGATDEAPSKTRSTYQPDRYGKQWAPVLITWSTPEESPDLAGKVAGTGGSAYAHIPGEPYVFVAGQVTLDAPGLREILARTDGSLLVRAIILHELAHVLGLDHVDDPTQLMHEENSGQFDFAAGDRAGLALLGTGACVPRL